MQVSLRDILSFIQNIVKDRSQNLSSCCLCMNLQQDHRWMCATFLFVFTNYSFKHWTEITAALKLPSFFSDPEIKRRAYNVYWFRLINREIWNKSRILAHLIFFNACTRLSFDYSHRGMILCVGILHNII